MSPALVACALAALPQPTAAQDAEVWRRPPQLEVDRAIDAGAAYLREDMLHVAPARLPGYPDDELARPLELRATVNGERELRVPLSPDPSQPARVDLGEPLEVRELELCILARVPGRRGAVVGLGEVELTLASE